MKSLLYCAGGLLIAGCFLLPSRLPAQSISTKAGQNLTEQQARGEGLFLQRCSLCHLVQGKRLHPDAESYGPSLTGLLRDASAAKEKAIRGIISKGGARMPGFQYGLTPEQMDDLIAFLKTL